MRLYRPIGNFQQSQDLSMTSIQTARSISSNSVKHQVLTTCQCNASEPISDHRFFTCRMCRSRTSSFRVRRVVFLQVCSSPRRTHRRPVSTCLRTTCKGEAVKLPLSRELPSMPICNSWLSRSFALPEFERDSQNHSWTDLFNQASLIHFTAMVSDSIDC